MIDWAVASRQLAGQQESGDAYAVVRFDGGTLLSVVDGLGHGPEAAAASSRAIELITDSPTGDIVRLAEAMHAALHSTRGAVASFAAVSDSRPEMVWLGVGDVSATLVRMNSGMRNETLLLRPGIIGQNLPRLQTESLQLCPGDALVMCTDGIQSRHIEALGEVREPHETANRILAEYARGYDDALVLVACYAGAGR